jgi:hypothetical protein
LKRLDSHERIQGNPRKSNGHERGLSQRNSEGPRKPKRIDWNRENAKCDSGISLIPF